MNNAHRICVFLLFSQRLSLWATQKENTPVLFLENSVLSHALLVGRRARRWHRSGSWRATRVVKCTKRQLARIFHWWMGAKRAPHRFSLSFFCNMPFFVASAAAAVWHKIGWFFVIACASNFTIVKRGSRPSFGCVCGVPTRTPLKLPQENRASACHQHYYLRLSARCFMSAEFSQENN